MSEHERGNFNKTRNAMKIISDNNKNISFGIVTLADINHEREYFV
jgi:hypothetical protein